MKKYLLKIESEVACSLVGTIKIVTEEQLKTISLVTNSFGDYEGDSFYFDPSTAKEITNSEIEVLTKFGINDLMFGECYLNTDNGDYIK